MGEKKENLGVVVSGAQTNKAVLAVLNQQKEEDHDIDAFDPDGDELAGVSKEELLDRLGVTGKESELVKAKVVVDGIDGEKHSSKIPDTLDYTMDDVNSIQDLNPEAFKKQLHDLAKQNISILLQDSKSDEEIEEIVTRLEKKVIDKSRIDLKNLKVDEVREFIGADVYAGIKKYNDNASSVARNFILDLKDSVVQVQGLVDTMGEMRAATEFFKKMNIDEIHKEITSELDEESDKYKTEIHKYREYLLRYIDKMKDTEDYEDNKFVVEEITVSEQKIKAIDEALTFDAILRRAKSIKGKMEKDFKSMNKINKVIWDFIGKLNSDQSINITFPVPKNWTEKESNDPKRLAAIWLLFIEIIDMYGKIPEMDQLSHAEYHTVTELVLGEEIEETEDNKEYLDNVKKFIQENKVTKDTIFESRKMAIIFSYLLARTFKPTRLNNEHTKYVLSYTMNILSQSMQPGYRELTLDLFKKVKTILSDN